MEKNAKIYVAGHKGLVGSAITRALEQQGYQNLILKTRKELDLLDQKAVADFFASEKPEYVFLAAAKVGGIVANDTEPAGFIYENLTIQNNIIHNAHLNKTKKLMFLGSSCIYPKLAPQPIREDSLLTGPLEETNIAYAAAKIAGVIMCQSYRKQYGDNFISVMPTNLYGPNDNFDPEKSHVIPGMIGKFHKAKMENARTVTVWGPGSPYREFLHSDDMASACIFLMNNYDDPAVINIGTGIDLTIKDLAELIKKVVGFPGDIVWDTSRPDGSPKKQLDMAKLFSLGWQPKIPLEQGLKNFYDWYVQHA